MAVFPPCCLTCYHTMVEVMKKMATSFKMSSVCTATLSAPESATGHCQPMPPPGTPGHSQASLGQSFVGSPHLSPGSWCAHGFVCALQEPASLVLCKFWLMATTSKRAYATSRSTAPKTPTSVAGHCWPIPPQETLKHLKAGLAYLCGVFWCAQGFIWAFWASLAGRGFDSKCDFAPPTVFLGLLLCPGMWGIFFDGIQHSPVVDCSAASCNFGALLGEDESTSFYSVILLGVELLQSCLILWPCKL